MKKQQVIGLVVVGVAVAVFVFIWINRGGVGMGPGVGVGVDAALSADAASLELTRTALSETETLRGDAADLAWNELAVAFPDDASVQLNRALNRILRVDELSAAATNAGLDADAKAKARQALPAAIASARESYDTFGATSGDAVSTLWLRSRIDLHEASLLPGSMGQSIRRDVFGRLSAVVDGDSADDPGVIKLGGVMIGVLELMEDPIDGLPVAIAAPAADAVSSLADKHSDNLYFVLRAARLNIDTQNPRAIAFVRRAGELTAAIEPSIGAETRKIGKTPAQLIDEIADAIAQADWDRANQWMQLWFNVLSSSEIVKTDRRRANPHPLDLLSFATLRRLSIATADSQPVVRGTAPITMTPTTLADSAGARLVRAIDFDLDLDTDVVTIHDDGELRLWRNDAGAWSPAGRLTTSIVPSDLLVADLFVVDSSDPRRQRVRATSDADGTIPGARHNTVPSLVVAGDAGAVIVVVDGSPDINDADRLRLLDVPTGLEDLRGITAAVAGDLESDGDLDLVFATRESGLKFFINRGNQTFFPLADLDRGHDFTDSISGIAIADLDRDLDLDLVTTHSVSGRVGLVENLLHLQFRYRVLDDIAPIAGASSVAVEEIDGNVSWDLIVGGTSQTAIVFSQTSDAGAWVVEDVQTVDHASTPMVAADLDNDSFLNVIGGGEVTSVGSWGFADWQPIAGPIAGPETRDVTSVDFNADGLPDVAIAGQDGVVVAINTTAGTGHYVDVRFRGIDDNASGRVNHYAIGAVLETRFGPHYRAKIVTSPVTHFGIDGFDAAGSVRAILPNGLTQTIREPAVDTTIEEEQTLKGSCPYLYAWDGTGFAFVTDCLWAAPLGLQVAPGIVVPDRPWEYLKIDGTNIRPRDGRYEFRITEELWEIAFFDQVDLMVVDHPPEVDIWTNEKVGPASIATPKVFAFEPTQRKSVVSARDTNGRDVTAAIAKMDREFVQGFDRRLRQGYCPPHWVDLDFGPLPADESDDEASRSPDSTAAADGPSRRYLVMTGWILPTDASLNIQLDQNTSLPRQELPSLWVPDKDEPTGWRCVIQSMGFPGGKTKTIVVDVTDAVNSDDPRLRVRTSAQIYWDAAELVTQSRPGEFRLRDAPMVAAEVGFHGFSRRIDQGPKNPETYDYGDASGAAKWPPLRGGLSRHGNCLSELQTWDDSMVVISAGDEIRLSFAMPADDPPPGWKRDFVLHSVGWDKDADLNTLTGQQVGPMPFKGMASYPPGPDDLRQSAEIAERNRGHLGRSQTFRSFWYRGVDPPVMRFHDGGG